MATVRVRSGDGLVARFGDVVVVSRGNDADLAAVVDGVSRLHAAGGAAADLLGLARSLSPGAAVAVAVVGAATDVVLLGGATCETVSGLAGREKFTGSSAAQVLALPDHVDVVTLSLARATDAGPAPAWSSLVAGVVPGGGVDLIVGDAIVGAGFLSDPHGDVAGDLPPTLAAPVIVAGSAASPVSAAPPLPPPPVTAFDAPPAPVVGAPAIEPVNLLLEPVTPEEHRPAPLPETPEEDPMPSGAVRVRGLACSLGHVNRLDAAYCSSCGRRLQGTVNLSEGRRPSLGTIIFDDGTTFGLDTGYVIGRDPGADAAVGAGRSHALTLDDPDRSISRVHAEIRLDGWDTVLVDRGSANGTYVYPLGGSAWLRVQPDVPAVLGDGWSVAVGRRTFVFQQR